MSRKLVVVLVCIIWCCSSLLSLPNLLYSTVMSYRYLDGSFRTLCFLNWPDGQTGVSKLENTYNIIFLLLTYLAPILAMAVTYSKMGRVLWGNKAIGDERQRQEQAIKSKQKVVKMLITMVLLFAICWLPYHVYFLYTYYNPGVIYAHYVQHVYLAIYWLAMSNSMYNPFVYYWMNGRFRGYFQRVLCFLRPRNTQNNTSGKSLSSYKSSLFERSYRNQAENPVRSFFIPSILRKITGKGTEDKDNYESNCARFDQPPIHQPDVHLSTHTDV